MKTFYIFISSLLLLACAESGTNHDTTDLQPGFDPTDLATDTRPQDDFFAYANGPWLERTEIPAEYSRYGVMDIVNRRTEEQLRELIDQVAQKENLAQGSDAQKIADLYRDFMNLDRTEELGVAPLADEFARIEKLRTHDDVITWFGHALTAGIKAPVNFYVDADAGDPERALAYLWQDGIGLPDRDYWLEDSEKLAAVRTEYVAHIERMFELAGWPDGSRAAGDIAKLERRIAEAHWTSVQNRDRQRIYTNQFSLAEAVELSPGFDWPAFLNSAGFGTPDTFVIAQTDYFAAIGKIVRTTPVEAWRSYAKFMTLKAFAGYLNDAIVREDFDFQLRTLRGQQEMKPRWKRGVRVVNGGVGELLGKLYVERHFPPDSKRRVEAMIENLRQAFSDSVETLDWMDETTKQAAQRKLDAFNAKIGYPDKWRDYSALNIVAGDLVGNVHRVRQFEHNRHVAKLSKPVDRSEWGMTPQTINAYYRPTWNEIVFPAAILQPPFFDPEVDDAFNYGAIGAVIGHEFSHGFDDQGRKFDGSGRLADWWTVADARQYEERSSGLVTQYDAFQALPQQAVNGQLTLGENIADLAGLTIAYRAWQLSLDGRPAPVIDGFTGDKRFFIGYAVTWRTKVRDEYLLRMLLSDPHSPPRYRVIGALRNMSEFYATFGVEAGDGMHLPAEQRVKIW